MGNRCKIYEKTDDSLQLILSLALLVVYFSKKILGNDAASLQNNGQNSILEAAKGCLKASMDVLTFLDLISKYYIALQTDFEVRILSGKLG